MPCYKMDHRTIHGALQSSPIVPVEKEDGTLRLCMDFRRLNSVTVPNPVCMTKLLIKLVNRNTSQNLFVKGFLSGPY